MAHSMIVQSDTLAAATAKPLTTADSTSTVADTLRADSARTMHFLAPQRSVADSTAVVTPPADRLFVTPYDSVAEVLPLARIDSLPPSTLWYALNREEVFGPASMRMAQPAACDMPRQLGSVRFIDSYTYQSIVLVVFVIFCYVLNRYRTSLGMVFKMVTGWLSFERTFGENALFFNRFQRLVSVWGVLVVAGVLIRVAERFNPERWMGEQSWAVEAVPLGVAVAIALIVAYRYATSRLIEAVIAGNSFFAELRFRNRVYSAFSCIVLTPLLLIVALAESRGIDRFMNVEAGVVILLIILYLGQSCRFFLSRNVSILQWILYLCAVEIFPVSFFVLAAVRNF